MGEKIIEVRNLHKSFRLPTEKSSGLKQAIINFFKGVKGYKEQKVLKNISFNVEKGDFFGIVGRNGSGKSTLLKLLAEIYVPEKGSIKINGSVVPFIELGVGFNPELTGRENVFLNGSLLGFSNDEIDKMYDDIVDFAELHEFMGQKLKNYSSGMQVRLAFSIAIKAQGDILILDEVLAVGDESFQRKCNDYFDKIKKDKKQTVILVTHGMDNVKKYCNKAIMIRDGKIVASGSPEDVANEYSLDNLDVQEKGSSQSVETGSVIKDFDANLVSPKRLTQEDRAVIKFRVRSTERILASVVVDLCDADSSTQVYCFGSPPKMLEAGQTTTFKVSFDISMLNNMNIKVNSSIRDDRGELLGFLNSVNVPSFMISRNDYKDNKRPQAGIIFKNGKNAVWL